MSCNGSGIPNGKYPSECCNSLSPLVVPHLAPLSSAPIVLPDLPDRCFIVESIRHCWARCVGVVPAAMIERRGLRPAAGHLQVAVGLGLSDPVPRITQPVGAGL